MLSDAIHWVTIPASLDKNRNISFFYWKIVICDNVQDYSMENVIRYDGRCGIQAFTNNVDHHQVG